MKTLAVEVKRQINEMSPDVYRKAAQIRANHRNTKAADELRKHADLMDAKLSNAIKKNDVKYVVHNFSDALYVKDGKICTDLEIIDDDTQDKTIVSLSGDNVKDVLEKMASVAQASIMDLSAKFFEVVFNKHQSALYKRFMRDMTEDEEAKFDAIIFNLARTAFKETENVDEVKDAIMKFNFKF
jgi:hypothetical protein